MKQIGILQATIIIFILLFAFISSANEQEKEKYRIHIINVDPGGELFMRFGHIAVIVEDIENETKTVYNFGTFDFNDSTLKYRYAKGFLTYWLSIIPLHPMIEYYHALGRGVTIRTLNFSSSQSNMIAEKLEVNAKPENATYAYRHYVDNCCTRIRDLFDDVLEGAISSNYIKETSGKTYRYWTYQSLLGMPIMRTVILFILGREIDKPITRWEEQFLPENFAKDLDELRIGQKRTYIVKEKIRLFDSFEPNEQNVTYIEEIAFIVVLFGLLLIGFTIPFLFPKTLSARRFTGISIFLWGLLGGFGGLLILLLWTATTHYDTHNNENILIFPVTHFWIVIPGLFLVFKATLKEKTLNLLKIYFLVCLGIIFINLILKFGPFYQSNYEYIIFAALCNLGGLLSVLKIKSQLQN